ncbi:MAG: response regulator [Candidatus Aminicenantes bacterium]|nr:response regulator [Candidatus Aminicenantes bacterium]
MAAKILVIDDDRVTASLLEKLLRKEGYIVFTASDGVSGFELVKLHQPELVISDMLLPRLHGIDLCKKIKEDPALNKTKIILITAVYKGTATETDIKNWGADYYFEKPINTKSLLEWIKANIPKEISDLSDADNKINLESMDIDEIMGQLESLAGKKR